MAAKCWGRSKPVQRECGIYYMISTNAGGLKKKERGEIGQAESKILMYPGSYISHDATKQHLPFDPEGLCIKKKSLQERHRAHYAPVFT